MSKTKNITHMKNTSCVEVHMCSKGSKLIVFCYSRMVANPYYMFHNRQRFPNLVKHDKLLHAPLVDSDPMKQSQFGSIDFQALSQVFYHNTMLWGESWLSLG